MRRKFLIFIILVFSYMGLCYGEPGLYSVVSDSYHSGAYGNKPVQFVTTPDGLQISVSADFSSSGDYIKFVFNIQNKSNKTFRFNEDSIKAYEGNFQKDLWYTLPYKTASKFYKEKERDLTVGAVVLGALTLGAIMSSDFDIDYNVSTSLLFDNSRLYVSLLDPDPILEGLALVSLFNLLDAEDDIDSLDYLNHSLLFSTDIEPGQEYTGVVFVPEGKGPDYKVAMKISPYESYYFTFARSDRDSIINPSLLNDDDFMFAILGGFPVPRITGGAFYSIISGSIIGGYFGFAFGNEGTNVKNIYGKTIYNDYGTLLMNFNAPCPDDSIYSYKYRFINEQEKRDDFFGMYCGLTAHFIPHLYLMAGCGVEYGKSIVYGTFECKEYFKEGASYKPVGEGWLELESELYCVPQVGINVSLGFFDFATIFDFVVSKGTRCNVLFGFGF